MSPTVLGSTAAPTRRARLPWALLTVAVVLVVAMVPLSLGQEPLFDTVFFGALVLALSTLGAFIATRLPGNPIGWIFLGLGVWGGVVETWEAFAYNSLPSADIGQWVVGWSWVIDIAAYVMVFALFPTGRLLSPRWRYAVWLLAAGCVLAVPGQALNPENPDNPFSVDSIVIEVMFGLGIMLVMVAMVASIVSVVMRFRRAVGVERLQLKQFVFAGGLLLPIMVVAIPFYYESLLIEVATGLAFLALPTAAGLAILRYRLYDIDVVINRTLVYGALTATLAAAYLGSVLLLQLGLDSFTNGSALPVAISTLAVAALFRPFRARIQAGVDRRFFRRKYDAVKTLENFGARLRDEVDLAALQSDLRAVVADTMAPAHVSLWLRTPDGAR